MTTQVHEVKADPQVAKIQAGPVNATVIDGKMAVVIEAEGNKGVLMQRLVTAFKALGEAENSLTKGLGADAVLSIVPLLKLPVKIRPKYAAIAEQIILAMGRGDIMARTQVRLPDETLTDRHKTPAYKQQATRWVNMARWEAGMYNKAEQKHQERNPGWVAKVNYNDHTFDSPVTMLRAGVAYTTVHQAFRNIMAPAFIDFAKLSERATEKAAKDQASNEKTSPSITIRTVNEDGDVVKGKVRATDSIPVAFGTIMGVLASIKAPLSQKRYDEVTEALLLVKPAPTAK